MAKQHTLGKRQRLKSRKLIEALFSKGHRLSVFPYRVFYLFSKKENLIAYDSLQFGVGAGTRNFKKAVDRNRIKRLTREAWRVQKSEIDQKMRLHSHSLSIFFIYTGKELPAFDLVKEKTAIIVEKLLSIADEHNTSHT